MLSQEDGSKTCGVDRAKYSRRTTFALRRNSFYNATLLKLQMHFNLQLRGSGVPV